MREIIFNAFYGERIGRVRLLKLNDGGYHIYVDDYYRGTLVKLNGEWELHSNQPELFTSDDIQILGEIIDNSKPPQI